MVIPFKQRVSLSEFEVFVALPENIDKTFELIGGEIFEMPSNPYASKIAGKLFGELYIYLKTHDLGHLTGEAGGYMIGGERYAPDVAYISYERQPELAVSGYNPNPPELAVEVISDPANAEEQRNLRLKLTSYLAAGVVAWVVNTQTRRVEVHQVGESSQELDETDTLTASDILPGFRLPVKDIFPPAKV
jgi:Uma2 family endonuclease